jgi:hypothetical protein
MRTTVDIPDRLYRRLKTRAANEGTSAKSLILSGVEQVLEEPRHAPSERVTLPLVRSKRPSQLRLDNARIYDVIALP